MRTIYISIITDRLGIFLGGTTLRDCSWPRDSDFVVLLDSVLIPGLILRCRKYRNANGFVYYNNQSLRFVTARICVKQCGQMHSKSYLSLLGRGQLLIEVIT